LNNEAGWKWGDISSANLREVNNSHQHDLAYHGPPIGIAVADETPAEPVHVLPSFYLAEHFHFPSQHEDEKAGVIDQYSYPKYFDTEKLIKHINKL
jgi:hypothetical protein